MTKEKRGYLSYLLRLWQIKQNDELVWRASLESPGSGQRAGFSSLDDVMEFLQQQMRLLPEEKGVGLPLQADDEPQNNEKGGI